MKGIDIFCVSQSATAICLSMEQDSASSPSSTMLLRRGGGGRAIDRHNPIIRDSRRIPKSLPPCSTSQPPLTPKPQNLHHKKNKKFRLDENINKPKKTDDDISSSLSKLDDGKIDTKTNDGAAIARKSWSCTKPGDFLSPPSSSRYLLREKVLDKAFLDSESTMLSIEENPKSKDVTTEDSSSSDSSDQVVVLRVSLHCRGCERKLRKHLSRMEGVTSFNIDFAAKKVTVTGNVTPLGVLSSISKVKNAQLWSPAISSSITPSSINLSTSEFKNDYKEAGA